MIGSVVSRLKKHKFDTSLIVDIGIMTAPIEIIQGIQVQAGIRTYDTEGFPLANQLIDEIQEDLNTVKTNYPNFTCYIFYIKEIGNRTIRYGKAAK